MSIGCALGVRQLVPLPRTVAERTLAEYPHPASVCHLVFLIGWWLKFKDSCLEKRRWQERQELQSPGRSSISSAVSAKAGTKGLKGKGIALYHPTAPGEECPTLQVDNLDGRFYSQKTWAHGHLRGRLWKIQSAVICNAKHDSLIAGKFILRI